MNSKNSAAFPYDEMKHDPQTGMSLRDYFAAAALRALASDWGPKRAAEEAYAYADAMLAEREKQS